MVFEEGFLELEDLERQHVLIVLRSPDLEQPQMCARSGACLQGTSKRVNKHSMPRCPAGPRCPALPRCPRTMATA